MKYTNEILSVLTPLCIGWFVIYLVCSFVVWSFDITEWTQQARYVCAVWGTAFGAALWYRLEHRHD